MIYLFLVPNKYMIEPVLSFLALNTSHKFCQEVLNVRIER